MTRYSKYCPKCGKGIGMQASKVIRGGYVKMYLSPDFPDHVCPVGRRKAIKGIRKAQR